MLKIFNLDSFMNNDLEVLLSNIYGCTENDSELTSAINYSFSFLKREEIDIKDFIRNYRLTKKNIVEVVKEKNIMKF